MPMIHINGQPVDAPAGQTVMQVALANGYYIPYFCWHPRLSVAGNCRICMVEVEGQGLDIACNMPVWEGMKVLTDSDAVREQRKATLELLTLNHPVDCGICDKAGECTLQDYHYAYNGQPSVSRDPKVRGTKFHALSERIMLDNERCVACSRCVRFTREISKSHAIGIKHRADHSLVRAAEDGALDRDPYSDNVIDLCPVGALLSRQFLYKARVWYLQATPQVCPGCERGCTLQVWHRKPEWRLKALDPKLNTEIARVTPLDNPAVNGPWICNKGRDLARQLGRARALEPMLKGRVATEGEAVAAARALIGGAHKAVALVSSWGSNEELESFRQHLGARFRCHVKQDRQAEPGERLEDDLLIKPDKNPNGATARALFGAAPAAFDADTDLVLVWGEGCNFAALPRGARVILLSAWLQPENGHADVFLPLSIQTERGGHYTNFAGVTSAFEACFPAPAGTADAESLFARLAGREEALP